MIRPVYSASQDRYDGRMNYRRCGKSGIKMPEISLGLWHNFGSVNLFENALDIVHFAFDNGITCFDLANNYGPYYGSAEETFGRMMEKSLAPYRDELFIISKAGYDMWEGPYGEWGSRKYLISSLNQSLKRLKVDYVDLFYSHRYDPDTPLEETLQTLVDIVKCGKALYVGISNYPAEVLDFVYKYLADRDTPCLAYQGRYNMMNRELEREGILDISKKAGVGVVAFSPLAQGLLTNRYLSGIPEDSRMAKNAFLKKSVLTSDMLSKLKQLDEIASSRNQSLSEMALSWLLKDDMVTSAIVGASSVEQLKTNIKSVSNINFNQEELTAIETILG